MLRFSKSMTENDLRQSIIECGQICYERRLMTANDGNISVRVGDNQLLITPSGLCKGRMEPGDLLLMGLNGEILSANDRRKPSSETPMHLEAYRQRPDIRAVLHAHPVFATTLTVSDSPFPVDMLPEVLLTLGEVPTTRYATPSSHDDAEAIRELIRSHDALLLRQHGSLTVGKDLDAALTVLERIEHVAEVFWRARMLGKVKHIPQGDVEKLLKVRNRFQSGM